MKYYTESSKMLTGNEVVNFKDCKDCKCQPKIIEGKRFTRFECEMCGYSIQDIEFLETAAKWNKLNMTATEIGESQK